MDKLEIRNNFICATNLIWMIRKTNTYLPKNKIFKIVW
jgi:hypothetical protein